MKGTLPVFHGSFEVIVTRVFAALLQFWLVPVLAFSSVSANEKPSDSIPPRELRVGYIEFPPFEYTNENGEPAGYFIDILRLTFQKAGFVPRFQALPIARAYLFLKEGKIDVWPGL